MITAEATDHPRSPFVDEGDAGGEEFGGEEPALQMSAVFMM